MAQLAALANNPDRPAQIEKVFAFESSPETGGGLVEEAILKRNSQRLEIDRVGQVGDASSYLQTLQIYIDHYIKEKGIGGSRAGGLLRCPRSA